MAYNRIKCPQCDQTFGQEKRFRDHLTDIHGVINHEAYYIEVVLNGVPTLCNCGCGTPTKWAGWKKGYTSRYLRGHNASIDSVYLDPARQKEFAQKRKEGYAKGKYQVWNDGLTKETSDVLQQAAIKKSRTLREGYASGKHIPWQLGKTKETDASVAKISETRKSRLSSGEIKIWNDGLTKETDPRVKRAANAIFRRYKQREMGRRLNATDVLKRVQVHSDKFELLSQPDDYRTRRVDRLKFRCVGCDQIQFKSLAMLEESPSAFIAIPRKV